MKHTVARGLVEDQALPGMLAPAESLALRAVAWIETNYGDGWKGEGVNSNNWGAITMRQGAGGTCPGGFAHRDSRYDSSQGKVVTYVTCFRRYQTPADGARHLYEIMFKDNVKAAAAMHNLRDISEGMRTNNYYLGTQPTRAKQVDAHYRRLRQAIRAIVNATGEADPFGVAVSGEDVTVEPDPAFGVHYDNTHELLLPLLQAGSHGNLIKLWQRIVNQSALFSTFGVPNLTIDGFFGRVTDKATKAYQKAHKLDEDGLVGRKTWSKAP